jgi:hypothetical protein
LKLISKIAKYLGLILVFLIFVLGLAVLWLNSPWGQRVVIGKVADFLSDGMKTEVSIESFRLKSFQHGTLRHVLIKDQSGDTLIYTNQLTFSFRYFDTEVSELQFDRLGLDGALVNFKQNDSTTNFDFLSSAFSSETADTTAPTVFTLLSESLTMTNSEFRFITQGNESTAGVFDEENIQFKNINADFRRFALVGDSVAFLSKSFSSSERSGLSIENLMGQVAISNSEIAIRDGGIATEHSKVLGELVFKTQSYSDYSRFETAVYWNHVLDSSLLGFEDLQHFGAELEPIDLKLDGKVYGRLDNLKGKRLYVSYGSTQLMADAKMKGLPNVETAYYDLDIDEYSTNYSDLTALVPGEVIPEEIKRFKQMKFSGQFLGFLNDFVAFGSFQTPMGNFNTDINLKINEEEASRYSGKLNTDGFELGSFYNNPDFGRVAFNVKVDGSGFTIENMDNQVEGNIGEFVYQGYRYQDISLDGKFDQKEFSGIVTMDDPNVGLDFEGSLNFNEQEPVLRFNASLEKANLAQLGIDSTITYLDFNVRADIVGLNPDKAEGRIVIDSVGLVKSGEPVEVERLIISSHSIRGQRDISVWSDFARIELSGDYRFSDLEAYSNQLLHSLFPDYYTEPIDNQKTGNLAFNGTLKRPEVYAAFMEVPIHFSPIEIMADYSGRTDSFLFSMKTDTLSYDSISTLYFNASAENAPNEQFAGMISANEVLVNNQTVSRDVEVVTDIQLSRIAFDIHTSRDTGMVYLMTKGEVVFDSGAVIANLASFVAGKDTFDWTLSEPVEQMYAWEDGRHSFERFKLVNKDQSIVANGSFSGRSGRSRVSISNLNLAQISDLTGGYVEMAGRMNGMINLQQVGRKQVLTGTMTANGLSIGGELIGDVAFRANTAGRNDLIQVIAKANNGAFENTEVSGKIDLRPEAGEIDLLVKSPGVKASVLDFVFSGLMSELGGGISIDGKIYGSFEEPKMDLGYAWNNATFLFDYTQVRYRANVKGNITDKKIVIDRTTVSDMSNGTAELKGRISHQFFDDIKMDVRIDKIKNLKALNTTKADNELFYGNATADGSVAITGGIDQVKIRIDAKPDKSTRVKIPLETEPENISAGYVKFVNGFSESTDRFEPRTDLSGVELDMQLVLEEGPTVDLIFNEQLDDRITATGTGNLKLVVNTLGDFEMYGEYVIKQGQYHFSALDVISKNFDIEEGSRLVWDGNPYNAQMSVKATKRENAAPYDLLVGQLSEDELEPYRTKVPVETELYLEGLLYAPEIKFSFNFVNTGALQGANLNVLDGIVQRIKQNEEEENTQVFALLVLGSFVPPSFTGSTLGVGEGINSTINNSVGDIVSNQLSKWLSQIDPKFQVGIDYQGATADNQSELILSLKRKFFNDQLVVSGSVDARGGNGNNPYDVNVQYNISEDGRFNVRGFVKSANDPTLGQAINVTTTGIGFYYTKEFDRFFKKKKKVEPEDAD